MKEREKRELKKEILAEIDATIDSEIIGKDRDFSDQEIINIIMDAVKRA